MDPLEKVRLDGSEKFTYIGSLLSNEEREQLQLVLLNNIDVFPWSHSVMVGINPTVASKKLNIITTDGAKCEDLDHRNLWASTKQCEPAKR